MAETLPVIVAGAGPGGLTAALCLVAEGVKVVVCERGNALAIDLRAGSYHPPTLEMLAPYGVTDRMHEEGLLVPRWQIRDREEGVLAELDLGLLADVTPYPYRLHLEQHKLTPILLETCRRFEGFEIRFGTAVAGLEQDAGGVTATLEGAGGAETLRGSYLVGADGHHSAVRNALGIPFEGFTWPEMFLVLSTPSDFERHGFARATYIADPDEWLVLFKVPGLNPPALWRLAFPVDPAMPPESFLSDEALEARMQRVVAQDGPYEIVHRTTYRVHQRVAASYGKGRVALVGDAAHVNNPLGGMGLNGAVHDAVSLAEKIAAAWRGRAAPDPIGLYERQRRPVQIEYVQNLTIRNKRLIEERDPAVRARRHDELRAIGADPERARAYLLDSSMISMVRKAAQVG